MEHGLHFISSILFTMVLLGYVGKIAYTLYKQNKTFGEYIQENNVQFFLTLAALSTFTEIISLSLIAIKPVGGEARMDLFGALSRFGLAGIMEIALSVSYISSIERHAKIAYKDMGVTTVEFIMIFFKTSLLLFISLLVTSMIAIFYLESINNCIYVMNTKPSSLSKVIPIININITFDTNVIKNMGYKPIRIEGSALAMIYSSFIFNIMMYVFTVAKYKAMTNENILNGTFKDISFVDHIKYMLGIKPSNKLSSSGTPPTPPSTPPSTLPNTPPNTPPPTPPSTPPSSNPPSAPPSTSPNTPPNTPPNRPPSSPPNTPPSTPPTSTFNEPSDFKLNVFDNIRRVLKPAITNTTTLTPNDIMEYIAYIIVPMSDIKTYDTSYRTLLDKVQQAFSDITGVSYNGKTPDATKKNSTLVDATAVANMFKTFEPTIIGRFDNTSPTASSGYNGYYGILSSIIQEETNLNNEYKTKVDTLVNPMKAKTTINPTEQQTFDSAYTALMNEYNTKHGNILRMYSRVGSIKSRLISNLRPLGISL